MKFIQLTDDDITELENIINCLNSNDDETFKLGRSLLETKFGINFWIPANDVYIPFEPNYYKLQYAKILNNDFSFVIQVLNWLIISKYYVTL